MGAYFGAIFGAIILGLILHGPLDRIAESLKGVADVLEPKICDCNKGDEKKGKTE